VRAVSLWCTHLNLPGVRFKRCGGSKQAVLREKLAHKVEDNIGLSQTTQSIVIIISHGGGSRSDHAYPLFKTHKLTPENLLNVDIKEIPVRLLQSAGNISTLRITAFLEFILKPISTEFCKNCPNEFCQDSCQYIGDLLMWKERLTKKLETVKQKPVFYIVAADMKALYPSLYRDTVTKALECALEKHSDYSAEACKIIIELNKICLNNVVTQYGDQLLLVHTKKQNHNR